MAKVCIRRNTFQMKPISRAVVIACGLTGVAISPMASAQDDNSLALEEIVVTAQKRDQSLQDVPVSISVLGSSALENNGVQGLEDIAELLPAMSYVSLGPGTGNVYMRGISSGGESALGSNPNVAVYMDEQPVTAVGAFMNPHIYDIERIETLAGPQGTLFGANAQAGSMRIITKKADPGEFLAGFDLEGNSVNQGGNGSVIEGFVNIPIGDTAAVRVVAWRKDEAGYIDNVPGSHTFDYQYIRDGLTDPGLIAEAADITIDNAEFVEEDFNTALTTGGRASLRVDLNDNWTITAGVMRQHLESVGVWDHDPVSVGDLEVVRYQPDTNDDEWTQLSLVVEGQIGGMTLTYAGSDLNRDRYFEADYSLYSDASLSPGYVSTYYSCYVSYFGACEDPSIIFTGDNKYERTNHELRLVSNPDSRFRWLAGVFYEDASHAFDLEWHVLGLANLNPEDTGAFTPAALEQPDIYWTTDQHRSNTETAFFGEVAFDFTDSLTAAVSARYFDYDSQLIGFSGTVWWPDRYGPRVEDYNTNLETNDSDYVIKASLSYSVNDAVMVYGSYSEGYRPGGLNRVYNTEVGGVYLPDFLESIEIGAKTTWMDGRMRLNAALYSQKWDDFQLSKIDTSVSVLTLTDNVGKAESKGVEFDGSVLLTDGWDLNFGLSYIDSTLSEGYWLKAADEGVTDPQAPAGTELPRVPRVKWNLNTRYTWEMLNLNSYVQASYTHTGASYNLLYGTSVTRSREEQGDYQILNMAWGLDSGKWAAELFVTNATDERGRVFVNGATYDQRVTTNRPRTIGVRFGMTFQ